jgi:hypothetical protein
VKQRLNRERVTRGDKPLYVEPGENGKWKVFRWDGMPWREKYDSREEAIEACVNCQKGSMRNDELDRKLRDAYQIASGSIPDWEMDHAS